MEDQYYIRELSREEMDVMFDSLIQRWDISNEYWYPLYDTKANPVIAFDSDAFEKQYGFDKLQKLFKELNEIIEIRENKYKGYIVKIENFEPAYEGTGEGYWFDSTLDWIIYCSHEGSITFGGEWLINKIKVSWKEWNRYLY